METLLRHLARLTPGKVLGYFWLAAIVLSVFTLVKALEGIATAALLVLFVGYPYVVILGMPEGIVRLGIRRWSRIWFVVLIVVAAFVAVAIPLLPDGGYSTPVLPGSIRHWLELALALIANVAVFSPFFVGAAALNDTREAMRQSATLESIPNFLALCFWPFGGVLHVHRRVREVLDAV